MTEKQKQVKIDVLAYKDTDNADGSKTRSWVKTSVTYRIIDEEKYAGMTLSVLQSFHKSQTLAPQKNIRVFLSNFIDEMRGSSVQEIASNDEIEGLVIKRGATTSISNEEALELLHTGRYQVRKQEGTKLVLPAVLEES